MHGSPGSAAGQQERQRLVSQYPPGPQSAALMQAS